MASGSNQPIRADAISPPPEALAAFDAPADGRTAREHAQADKDRQRNKGQVEKIIAAPRIVNVAATSEAIETMAGGTRQKRARPKPPRFGGF